MHSGFALCTLRFTATSAFVRRARQRCRSVSPLHCLIFSLLLKLTFLGRLLALAVCCWPFLQCNLLMNSCTRVFVGKRRMLGLAACCQILLRLDRPVRRSQALTVTLHC